LGRGSNDGIRTMKGPCGAELDLGARMHWERERKEGCTDEHLPHGA
jgi:hypothetical protein